MNAPCAVSIDLRDHEARQARLEAEQAAHLAPAMDDLVYRLMKGGRYPATGYPAIDLYDFVTEKVSGKDLFSWLHAVVNASEENAATVCYDISAKMEDELRAYLDGSEFVQQRAAEMAQEEYE